MGTRWGLELAVLFATSVLFGALAFAETEDENAFAPLDLGGVTCSFRSQVTHSVRDELLYDGPSLATTEQSLGVALKKSCEACRVDLRTAVASLSAKGKRFVDDRCVLTGCTYGQRAFPIALDERRFNSLVGDETAQARCKRK